MFHPAGAYNLARPCINSHQPHLAPANSAISIRVAFALLRLDLAIALAADDSPTLTAGYAFVLVLVLIIIPFRGTVIIMAGFDDLNAE